MKAFWTYTLARAAVFAAVYGVLWLLSFFFLESSTLGNLLVLFVALVVSSAISVFALAGLRDKLARDISDRAARMTERIEESRRAEDVD